VITMTRIRYILGVDIGQAKDPTALALIEHTATTKPSYQLRALHRFPLGTPYPRLVEQIGARLSDPPLRGRCLLAIDATGVGAAVLDLFRQQQPRPSSVYGITITSGTSPGGSSREPTVPKRDLVAAAVVLLQQQRLRIAPKLLDTNTLVDELLSYRITTSETGHDRYAPASSDGHDDLLLALSLALWLAENRPFRYAQISVPRGRIPLYTHTDPFSSIDTLSIDTLGW
jgi:hypothetical protein